NGQQFQAHRRLGARLQVEQRIMVGLPENSRRPTPFGKSQERSRSDDAARRSRRAEMDVALLVQRRETAAIWREYRQPTVCDDWLARDANGLIGLRDHIACSGRASACERLAVNQTIAMGIPPGVTTGQPRQSRRDLDRRATVHTADAQLARRIWRAE